MLRSLALALILALPASVSAHAQASDSSSLRIRAVRRDTIRATSTVTAAFNVANDGQDSASVMPHVEMPTGWSVLMGGSNFAIAGRSSEMLMLSVVVPSRAPAGLYPIRVWLTTSADTKGKMDSVVVLVPPRRALDVTLLDRPGFVVSGRNYDASFQVRNRGNAPADLRVGVRASLSAPRLSDTVLTLAAEETRVVKTNAVTRAGLQAAADDVLEIVVEQAGDTADATVASVRVTVVPEPTRKIEEFLRMPLRANVRAANGGVSPFEIAGAGYLLDGSPIRAELLARGNPGAYSAFGERDEYRLQLNGMGWRARFGDHFFMLSPLTGGAQPGFGIGADGARGRFSAGAYAQDFRHDPTGGNEAGATLGADLFEGARAGVNYVHRSGGRSPADVTSATASAQRGVFHGDFEVARSSAADLGSGAARSARAGFGTSRYALDLGHAFADTSFSGSQSGAQHNYLTGSAQVLEQLAFGVNASRHRTDLSRSTGVPYVEHLDVAMLSTTLFERYTIELQTLARGTDVSGIATEGTQNGVRFRGDQEIARGMLSLEAEAGRSRDPNTGTRDYNEVSVSARRAFSGRALGAWVERYSGGSVTKGLDGSFTVGGDASLRFGPVTTATLMGYATRPQSALVGWHSQLDALVSRELRNGASLTLRARLIGGGTYRRTDQTVAFLEYGMPLRVPISRLRTPGRVRGRVVDAVTGTGVPGALVRLGPQVAITDNHGEVAFGGVPAGEHRLSMSQETSFADAVFVGDPTLMVDSARTRPTEFRLAIARSARVNVAVRRYAARQTAIPGVAGAVGITPAQQGVDSLIDAGPLANATLVLTSDRDTLYRSTNESGIASFTDVPPGTWLIAIRGDAPAYHRFDPDRLELELQPGETKALAFRLLPRKRDVQIIGDGQELKSTAGEAKAAGAAGGTRVIKPDEKIKQDRQDRQDR